MAESRRMDGLVAVVTGAAHGIGAATVRAFVGHGARVVIADLDEAALDAIVTDIGDDRAVSVPCDVSDPGQMAEAVAAAEREFDGLDVLVNNAGLGSTTPLEEIGADEIRRVLDVNLGGVFAGIKHATPAMRRRGGGSIVNLSSISAHRAISGMAAYAAAKAGVEAVTRCAAVELRVDGIRVNAIAPAMVRSAAVERNTPILERALGMTMDDFLERRQGRWGEPADVARVAVHLASDESSFTSGQTYILDHGASALL